MSDPAPYCSSLGVVHDVRVMDGGFPLDNLSRLLLALGLHMLGLQQQCIAMRYMPNSFARRARMGARHMAQSIQGYLP